MHEHEPQIGETLTTKEALAKYGERLVGCWYEYHGAKQIVALGQDSDGMPVEGVAWRRRSTDGEFGHMGRCDDEWITFVAPPPSAEELPPLPGQEPAPELPPDPRLRGLPLPAGYRLAPEGTPWEAGRKVLLIGTDFGDQHGKIRELRSPYDTGNWWHCVDLPLVVHPRNNKWGAVLLERIAPEPEPGVETFHGFKVGQRVVNGAGSRGVVVSRDEFAKAHGYTSAPDSVTWATGGKVFQDLPGWLRSDDAPTAPPPAPVPPSASACGHRSCATKRQCCPTCGVFACEHRSKHEAPKSWTDVEAQYYSKINALPDLLPRRNAPVTSADSGSFEWLELCGEDEEPSR